MGEIFLAPALVGLATIFGLAIALVGDGILDIIGCLSLCLPLAAIAYGYLFGRFGARSSI